MNKFNKATNLFYKTPENLSCSDVFVTNRPQSFCNSHAIETELSDFHTMTVSVMKMHYRKHSPKVINYREKKFSNGNFLNSVKGIFSSKNPNEENGRIDFFPSTCSKVLNKHASCKKKVHSRQSETFYEQTYIEGDYGVKKQAFKNIEWYW